jgi:hypothetical protein
MQAVAVRLRCVFRHQLHFIRPDRHRDTLSHCRVTDACSKRDGTGVQSNLREPGGAFQ